MNNVSWVLNQQLSSTVKLVYCAIIVYNNQSLRVEQLATILGTNTKSAQALLDKLIDGKSMTRVGESIVLPVENRIFKIHLTGYSPAKPDGSAIPTTVNKAREKLDQMRAVGFVGEEIMIYKLSLEYDSLFQQYVHKKHTSMPPVPRLAKTSRNWTAFKKTLEVITKNRYNPKAYLVAQFEATSQSKMGTAYPFPTMLHSKWARDNYVRYIKEHMETATEYKLLLSEDDIIRETMKASHDLLTQTREANPDLNQQQSIAWCSGSLAPVYLACCKEYLQFVNNTGQELDEDVIRILMKVKQNQEYNRTVKSIYQEVTGG